MNIPRVSLVNIDDERLRELVPLCDTRVVTFGESPDADYRAVISQWKKGYYGVDVRTKDNRSIKLRLSIPGRFNAMNAVAAAAVSCEYGVRSGYIEKALSEFCGIERRLEFLGRYRDNVVYYDYAHHPTEISCAIDTVREFSGKRIVVIFKPHTYSRTAGLMDGFVNSLSNADRVFLCEISAIRENRIKGVSSDILASKIGEKATKIRDANILYALEDISDSAIIIMGAADLNRIKDLILGKTK